MKEVRMVNGEVVDAEGRCPECRTGTVDGWNHCPECGADL